MEPTILQFLIGVLAGTAVGIVMVRRKGRGADTTPRANLMRSKSLPSTTRGRTTELGRARNSRHRKVTRRRNRVQTTIAPKSVPAPTVVGIEESHVAACPTCGLEAPEALLAEHFMGSPSHKNEVKTQERVLLNDANPPVETNREVEEDPRKPLRSLLQMLVPPRAFGHRHQQKTVNPLSSIIQRIEIP